MRRQNVASAAEKIITISLFFIALASFANTGLAQGPAKTKAGLAQLTVCRDVDDNWNPVGPSDTWPANKTFNVLLISPTPFKADFIGFIIFKQGPDGKDVEFVNEWQQTVENAEKARKYCTTEGLTSLPTGKYTLYAIDWTKREVSEHNGNLTDYFAKITLTVK